MIKRLISLLLICCSFSMCCHDELQSGIQGVVVDEANSPVANVFIAYSVTGKSSGFFSFPPIIKQELIYTDSLGRFEISELLDCTNSLSYVVQIPDLNLPYTSWRDNFGNAGNRKGVLPGENFSDVVITLLL